ncbi:MAG: hypothetical protein EA378_07030 [Phycisphaerales bacterium]|nr:MAG: hypothetical protein EA378_07030 [Phycisphaerales bacterium]
MMRLLRSLTRAAILNPSMGGAGVASPSRVSLGGLWTRRLGLEPTDPGALRRGRRVALLLLAVGLLSLGDLALTMTFLVHTGMAEGNPLARAVIGYNSAAVLVFWKLSTVVCTLAILFALRRRVSGELGAWVCVAVLSWLTFHWQAYIAQQDSVTACVAVERAEWDARWVRLSAQ